MIDIHNHILPGLDDGAGDIYDTIEMAHIAVDSGITAIVATPHCNIPGLYENYFDRVYKATYMKAVNALKQENIPLRLLPGMEIFATEDIVDLIKMKKVITLNKSRYILIEFDFNEDPEYADMILQQVRELGLIPVVAHVERYEFIQQSPGIVYKWQEKGYCIQINKSSFLGKFGYIAQKTAYLLLDRGVATVIASDAHTPYRRTPYLLEAYEELLYDYPKEYLSVLLKKNPYRICKNKEIIPLNPVKI